MRIKSCRNQISRPRCACCASDKTKLNKTERKWCVVLLALPVCAVSAAATLNTPTSGERSILQLSKWPGHDEEDEEQAYHMQQCIALVSVAFSPSIINKS